MSSAIGATGWALARSRSGNFTFQPPVPDFSAADCGPWRAPTPAAAGPQHSPGLALQPRRPCGLGGGPAVALRYLSFSAGGCAVLQWVVRCGPAIPAYPVANFKRRYLSPQTSDRKKENSYMVLQGRRITYKSAEKKLPYLFFVLVAVSRFF